MRWRKTLRVSSKGRRAATDDYQVDRRLQEAEITQRQEEAVYRKRYLVVYGDVRGRIEALAKEGLTSTVELLNHQLGHAAAERDAAMAEKQHQAAVLALERLDADHRQVMEELDQEEARLQVQIEGLDARLRHAVKDIVEVGAPYGGVILSLARKRAGDVVGVGQELCQIAPVDAPFALTSNSPSAAWRGFKTANAPSCCSKPTPISATASSKEPCPG